MMTKVKHALAFVLGCLYASSIWYAAQFPIPYNIADGEVTPAQFVFLLLAVLGSGGILYSIIAFLVDHWSEK